MFLSFNAPESTLEKDTRSTMLSLSFSMALIWLTQQLYSSVDMIIVGQVLGSDATAAIATAGDFTNVNAVIASALASGAAVYISQLFGAKDAENLRKAIGAAVLLLFLVAAIAVSYAFLFQDRYLYKLNCPIESLESARQYLLITAIGIPFIFSFQGCVSILKAMGEGKNPLIYVLLSSVINIAGDVLLVIVFRFGIVGSAIATVFSQGVCFLIAIYHLAHKKALFGEYSIFRFLRFDKDTIKRILLMAIPQVARIVLVQMSFLWLRSIANGYGVIEASTYSIWYKMERISNFVVFGVQEASANVIGQMIGARRLEQVKPVVRFTVFLGALGAVVPFLLFMTVPEFLYRLFTSDAEVIARSGDVLVILGIGLFINALGNGSKGISVGAGAWQISFMVGVLDAGARVVIGLICLNPLNMGIKSVYWAMAFAPLVPGIMCIWYLLSDKWKYRKVLSEL